MITSKQMNELSNEELAKIIVKLSKGSNSTNRFRRHSIYSILPYTDEYQRRLLDGRATGSYENYSI